MITVVSALLYQQSGDFGQDVYVVSGGLNFGKKDIILPFNQEVCIKSVSVAAFSSIGGKNIVESTLLKGNAGLPDFQMTFCPIGLDGSLKTYGVPLTYDDESSQLPIWEFSGLENPFFQCTKYSPEREINLFAGGLTIRLFSWQSFVDNDGGGTGFTNIRFRINIKCDV